LKPKYVEKEFRFERNDIQFVAHPDLVEDSDPPRIWEWKTADRKPFEEENPPLQVIVYAVAITNGDILDGRVPRVETRRVTAVMRKSGDVEVFDKPFVVEPIHAEFLFRVARPVLRAINAGIFPPNPNGWWCSAQFCQFYESCRKGF
jgi:hypothetical protein